MSGRITPSRRKPISRQNAVVCSRLAPGLHAVAVAKEQQSGDDNGENLVAMVDLGGDVPNERRDPRKGVDPRGGVELARQPCWCSTMSPSPARCLAQVSFRSRRRRTVSPLRDYRADCPTCASCCSSAEPTSRSPRRRPLSRTPSSASPRRRRPSRSARANRGHSARPSLGGCSGYRPATVRGVLRQHPEVISLGVADVARCSSGVGTSVLPAEVWGETSGPTSRTQTVSWRCRMALTPSQWVRRRSLRLVGVPSTQALSPGE